jgi:hypothetical protein
MQLPSAYKRVTWLFIILYALLSVYDIFVFIPGSNYAIDNIQDGIMKPPVAYRVLMPTVTSTLRALIPDVVAQEVSSVLIAMRDSTAGRQYFQVRKYEPAWNPSQPLPRQVDNDRIFDTSLKILVVYLSLLAFIAMYYHLALALWPDSRAYALWAPVLMLLLISVLNVHYAYTYDYPEIFFSCACFYLLLKQRWAAYILCLTIATLNKETTLFGIFFFMVWFYNRLPRKQYWMLAGLQLYIYVMIKVAVTIYYADRPSLYGTTFFNHVIISLRDNIFFLYGASYYNFVCFIATMLAIMYRWQEKPAFLRGGVWMLLPNMLAYIFMCNRGEYRDLYWSIPVMVLLATHTLVSITGIAHMPAFLPVDNRK